MVSRVWIIASIFAIAASYVTAAAADGSAIKIGAILPLTGKAASVGVSVRNGMVMAYQNLPPEVRGKLLIEFEDDASEVKQAVSAAQRLMSSGQIDLLLTVFSNTGNAVKPLAERHGMPYLSLAFDRKISAGTANTFTFWVNADDLAAAAIKESERRNYKNIAVIATQHEGNIAMQEALLSAGTEHVNFPFRLEIERGEVDFNTQVARLRSAGQSLDAAAVLMHPMHLGLFVKSLRANGIGLPLFALASFEDLNVRVASGGALAGQWYAGVSYAPWFLPAYQKQFPADSTFGASFGHDAVLLAAQALRDSKDRPALIHILRTGHIADGATPGISADGRNGFKFPVGIKVVGADGLDYRH